MKTALFLGLMWLGAMTLHAAERTTFDLTTLLGETFHGCRIIKVTPAALTVTYDSGVSRVPFELLGDAWKKLYHYDPDKARKFSEREEEKRHAAEARLKDAQRASEKLQTRQMNALLKAELQREKLEAELAREQAEADAKAAPEQPPSLVPFPGDAVVPLSPPISHIYTPGQGMMNDAGSGYPSGYPSDYSGGIYPYTYGFGSGYPPVVITPRIPFRGNPGRHNGPSSPRTFPGRAFGH